MKFGPMSEAITGPMRPVPIYVHIPKTGGTTYCTALMRSFHGVKRFSVMGLRNRNNQKIEQLFRLTEKQLNRIEIVFGHRTQGADRAFKHRTTKFYATVRSPFDRLKSHYRQNVKFLAKSRKPVVSFEQFIEAFDTPLAHYFFDHSTLQEMIQNGYNQKDMTAAALERIKEKYAVVGLTEKMDQSICLYNELLQLDIYKIMNLNLSPLDLVREHDHEAEDFREYFNQKFSEDLLLYQEISDRFEAQWTNWPDASNRLNEFLEKKGRWNAKETKLENLIPGYAQLRKADFEIRRFRY